MVGLLIVCLTGCQLQTPAAACYMCSARHNTCPTAKLPCALTKCTAVSLAGPSAAVVQQTKSAMRCCGFRRSQVRQPLALDNAAQGDHVADLQRGQHRGAWGPRYYSTHEYQWDVVDMETWPSLGDLRVAVHDGLESIRGNGHRPENGRHGMFPHQGDHPRSRLLNGQVLELSRDIRIMLLHLLDPNLLRGFGPLAEHHGAMLLRHATSARSDGLWRTVPAKHPNMMSWNQRLACLEGLVLDAALGTAVPVAAVLRWHVVAAEQHSWFAAIVLRRPVFYCLGKGRSTWSLLWVPTAVNKCRWDVGAAVNCLTCRIAGITL